MKARDKIYAQHLTNEKILQFSFVAGRSVANDREYSVDC